MSAPVDLRSAELSEIDGSDIDPIWTSSRTARQIYSLGQVEKDISRLLELAASSISLLTLPETDGADDGLPQGDERSERFVLEVTEYFQRLDTIQEQLRASLAHIRQSRIAPSAIIAPAPGFVPPSLGAGLPTQDGAGQPSIGLQEERVQRDAWKRIASALQKLKDLRNAEAQISRGVDEGTDVRMNE